MTHPVTSLRMVLALLAPLVAFAAPLKKFDIPAQSAATALPVFVEQANTPVIFNAAELKPVTANALKGEFEVDAGLRQLLAGSGFVAQQNRNGDYVVAKPADQKPGSIEGQVRDESGKPVPGAKVTLAGGEISAVTDRRGRFLLEEVPAGAQSVGIIAEGMQRTRVTDVIVRPGHRHTLSSITIPATVAGITQLEDYIVSAKKNDGVVELDPYEVEGQKPKPFTAANLDLTRTRDDPLPFTTFSARDIELSGAADLQDFLNNRLAQNFNTEIRGEMEGATSADKAFAKGVNMRGWNGETVFLLNGRRLPPQYEQALPSTVNPSPDLRSIPAGMIERIEILTSAGSAIYGAGATGGVVNIITRQDYAGGQLTMSYETPTDVHAPRRSVDLNYAQPLGRGFSLNLAASYTTSDALEGRDRADQTIRRWRRLVLERDPTRLQSRTITAPFGANTNIRTVSSAATANLFGTGTSNFTSVPAGHSGVAGLLAFQARAGTYDLEIPDSLADGLLVLGADSTVTTFNVGCEKAFGPNWRWAVHYRTNKTNDHSVGRSQAGQAGLVLGAQATAAATRVPASAPSNPFGQDVIVAFFEPRFRKPELKEVYEATDYEISTTMRAILGNWRGYLDFSYMHSRSEYTNRFYAEPVGGWLNAYLTGAYNPFVDRRVTPSASDTFFQQPYVLQMDVSGSAMKSYQAAGKINGPIGRLPAGTIILTAGAEWNRADRYNVYSANYWQDSVTRQLREPFANANGGARIVDNQDRRGTTETEAAYAEITVPVIAAEQKMRLARSFEVFGSGRWSHTNIEGFRRTGPSTVTAGQEHLLTSSPLSARTDPAYLHAFGVKFSPLSTFVLRASRSIGFIPPTIDLVAPSLPPTAVRNVTDPRRGNQTVALSPLQYVTGGNPDLNPETTESINYGVILSPTWAGGIRVSIDYLESTRNDAITSLAPQTAINLEADIPGNIQRGVPDGHPSGVGPLAFVDARNINFLKISSKSMDVALDKQFENVFGGQLGLSLVAAKNVSFKVQVSGTSPAVEQVRNPMAVFSRQMKWNSNAQVRWEGKHWGLGWSVRYFDEELASPTDYLLQGGDRADWALNHDFVVTYRPPVTLSPRGFAFLMSGTSITLGIKNVFDREPRFWAANASRGIVTADSVVGRSVWIQLRKEL